MWSLIIGTRKDAAQEHELYKHKELKVLKVLRNRP